MATSVDTEVVEVYLDHAASTPLRPEAQAAWLDASARHHANPTGAHRAARAARVHQHIHNPWFTVLQLVKLPCFNPKRQNNLSLIHISEPTRRRGIS